MKNQHNTYTQDRRDKRRTLLAILLLIAALMLITGVVIAYFSDLVIGGGNFQAGTLDIEGDYSIYINGVLIQSSADLQNLNPGDAVSIVGTITNVGSKSAWIREKISLTTDDPAILNYIEVYLGAYNQAELKQGTVSPASLLPLIDNEAISGVRVINGTEETEVGESFSYIGAKTYSVQITVYFSHLAGNDAQGKEFGLVIETQALQFRNNNTAVPEESAWDTVVSVG